MCRLLILLLSVFVLVACDKSFKDPKPENFIEKEVMEDIMYDIKLLSAARSKNFKLLKDNNVNSSAYIYNKYDIDSLTLRQNIDYYSTYSFKRFKEMEMNIRKRYENEKKKINAELKLKDSAREMNKKEKLVKEKGIYKSSLDLEKEKKEESN